MALFSLGLVFILLAVFTAGFWMWNKLAILERQVARFTADTQERLVKLEAASQGPQRTAQRPRV